MAPIVNVSGQPPGRGRIKPLPPHLRAKKERSENGGGQLPQGTTTERETTPSDGPGLDIRQKLAQEHGVVVGGPKPALVAYSTSNEGEPAATNSAAFRPKSTDEVPDRDQSRQRGRGGRHRGRGGRSSNWARPSDFPKPDPTRWESKWSGKKSITGSIDSAVADAGYGGDNKPNKPVQDGIDPDTGFVLTDWNGDWAPPPVDWDARPAFRDTQNSGLIEEWMDKIDEEMCGKMWRIPHDDAINADGITFYFAPDPKNKALLIQGEPAPAYWIPIVIDRKSPKVFWNELINAPQPRPFDKYDLQDAKPWWELHEFYGAFFLKSHNHPAVTAIDKKETREERLARENDFGSDHHAENRKRLEKAKKEIEREKRIRDQAKAKKISASSPALHVPKVETELKLYVCSAGPDDMPRICEIYNYYVEHGASTPETERCTEEQMLQKYQDVCGIKLPFLLACKRGDVVPSRKKRNQGEDIILPDTVVGFAFAVNHNGAQGTSCTTAEVEVYTDSAYYMKGIASCLMDKMIGLLDSDNYFERRGYQTVGDDIDGSGEGRYIHNVVVNVPYDKPKRLEWTRRWLENFLDFEQVCHLEDVGEKFGKSINLATFQRPEGASLKANEKVPKITKHLGWWTRDA